MTVRLGYDDDFLPAPNRVDTALRHTLRLLAVLAGYTGLLMIGWTTAANLALMMVGAAVTWMWWRHYMSETLSGDHPHDPPPDQPLNETQVAFVGRRPTSPPDHKARGAQKALVGWGPQTHTKPPTRRVIRRPGGDR